MTTALALITEQVRERVRREGIDVGSESELVGRFVRDELRAYSERALGGSAFSTTSPSKRSGSTRPTGL